MKTIGVIVLCAAQALCLGEESRLFWTDKDSGKVESSDLDGGNRVTILTGLSDPRGIVVDEAMGKIYWVTREGIGAIHSADLDGSNWAVVLDAGSSPADLAFDRKGRILYWADEEGGRIWAKTLDGDETPHEVIGGLNEPYYLAVDAEAGFLYWSEFDNTVIWRCTLAGENREVIVSGQSQVRDVEVADGTIYWCDRDSSDVRSRALAGSGGGTVLFSGGGMDRPHGLVLDPEENMLYWTDTRAQRVSAGAMDGTGSAEVIVSTNLAGAWAVALWKPQMDPQQEWLEENFTSEELNNPELEETVWGWNADPEEDGRENLLEYAQGTDPRIKSESPELMQAFVEGGEMQIKFRFRKDDPTLQFEVESTYDLSAALWDADEIGGELLKTPDATDPRFEFIQVESDTIDDATPRLFARLKVSR